jgi:hypothetical protein
MACSNDAFDLIAIVMTLVLIHLGLTLPLFNCMKFESVAKIVCANTSTLLGVRLHRPFLHTWYDGVDELDELLADANGSEMVTMSEGVDWCAGVLMGIAPDRPDQA